MKRKPFAFISYSRKDVEVAKYLQDRIEKYVYQKDHVAKNPLFDKPFDPYIP